MTAVQEFTDVFRTGHRHVHDLLLGLAGAFGDRDAGRARHPAAAVARTADPHFRHEEKAMYPQLDAGPDLLTWAATARDRA